MSAKLTKPKIAKADFTLLFLRINSIYEQLNTRTDEMERVYKFEHVLNRYAPADHIFSADKKDTSNCYSQLKTDCYYFIFAHRVHALTDVKRNGQVFHRWVWRAAVELSEKQIRMAYKFYVNHNDPKLTSAFVDSLITPSVSPVINEFDFGGENV